MNIFIKDKADFVKNYFKFAEMVFWREINNGKVEIKVALPIYAKEVKEKLKTIKD